MFLERICFTIATYFTKECIEWLVTPAGQEAVGDRRVSDEHVQKRPCSPRAVSATIIDDVCTGAVAIAKAVFRIDYDACLGDRTSGQICVYCQRKGEIDEVLAADAAAGPQPLEQAPDLVRQASVDER